MNGLSAIGRLALVAGWDRPALEFAHINDPGGDAVWAAHRLEFGGTRGRWKREIFGDCGVVDIGGKELRFSQAHMPARANWRDHGVETVLECSGRFTTAASFRSFLQAQVPRIVTAAPVEDSTIPVVVAGLEGPRSLAFEDIICSAPSVANTVAPIAKVLDEAIGVEHCSFTVVRGQAVAPLAHRSVAEQAPSLANSVAVVERVLPRLRGRVRGTAVGVPMPEVTVTDCVFEVARPTTREHVGGLLEAAAAAGPLRGVLGYEQRQLTAMDFSFDPRSAIIDANSTTVAGRTQVKVVAWCDADWSAAVRLIGIASALSRVAPPQVGRRLEREADAGAGEISGRGQE